MLIPTVIALSSFFASNFPNISWYPYWYLGNPYEFLIGPVVPIAIAIVQNSKFKIQNYDVYFILIFLSFIVGGFGIYLFLRDWRVGKRQAILSAILYLILPAGFYLLNFQNGLNHIAFGVVPFILLLYRRFLAVHPKGGASNLSALLISLSIAFVLLINISILLTLVIGFTALFVAQVSEYNTRGANRIPHRKWNSYDTSEKVAKTVLFLLLGISIATIWYTPRFWWVILSNPSFGGVPLFNLTISLFKLLLNLLPIVLAVIFVKWRRYKPESYLLFAVLFFSSFLFLSIVRFLSDPDFVMDWAGFLLELQFGGGIILGNIKYEILNIKNTYQKLKVLIISAGLVAFVATGWTLVLREWLINSNNEYQQRMSALLKQVGQNERVFLSGSPVFFINSHLDINQVRGGVDQGSIHPFWAQGAYQIREGESSELARDWLIALGASYILVHEEGSAEPFHDFKHPEKFADFRLIAADKRDKLYRIEGGLIGRIADGSILNIPRPKDGADRRVLQAYVSRLKRSADFSYEKPTYEKPNRTVVHGDLSENEVVSLAITFDSRWRVEEGSGKIFSDSLGNIVVVPDKAGKQDFKLAYKRFWYDRGLPVGGSLILLLIILYYPRLSPYIKARFPSFSFGLKDEEEE